MGWKGRRRRNRREEGIPGLGFIPGHPGHRVRVAADRDLSGEEQSAQAQASSSHRYNTRAQHSRFPEHYHGGRQHPRQHQNSRLSPFEEAQNPYDRKGKGLVHFPPHARRDYTYHHEPDKEVPFPRRDSSPSDSTDGSSPRYSPPPPPSPSPDDLPLCVYCLETRRMQEDLITHVNNLTGAVQALYDWHTSHSAEPSDLMEWQHDVTQVVYYREGMLGEIIAESLIVPPETERCEGCINCSAAQAASARSLAIDLWSAMFSGQHHSAANNQYHTAAPVEDQQTQSQHSAHMGAQYIAPTVEGESSSSGQNHTAAPVVDQQTQPQLLPSENTNLGYSAPTVEGESSTGGQYHDVAPVVDQQTQPQLLPSENTDLGNSAPPAKDESSADYQYYKAAYQAAQARDQEPQPHPLPSKPSQQPLPSQPLPSANTGGGYRAPTVEEVEDVQDGIT
ncbi:hypothetical protein CONLIGDRAFT_346655 [Coniochaeta ligniaria NRRL 30616]|uniref:Uncharacterized protein n=1 Tax=Coniochaeta ligniaria NRRL 30616 TaxID=1408157 RepID=A0A1J7J971_9PEZI|nr:hypothetical protein CONLIGDRAFT_346655 [Coniochaeta ligniaria NRRL 30616]